MINTTLDAARQLKDKVEYSLRPIITSRLPDTYIQIKSRVKSITSINDKIESKKQINSEYSLDKITDLVGFRFICHFQNDVAKIASLILELLDEKDIFIGLFEDPRLYITTSHNQDVLKSILQKLFKDKGIPLDCKAKDSRYTSVHLVCNVKDFIIPIEIQIRTVFEDAWSEIEHAINYKSNGVIPQVSERHLKVLNTLTQACAEYSEAIISDIKLDTSEKSGVKPMITPDNYNKAPSLVIGIIKKTVILQKEYKYAAAINLILEFEAANEDALNCDIEALYWLSMEKGLCQLGSGKAKDAMINYSNLIKFGKDNALLNFRLADSWRLLGEFEHANNHLEISKNKFDKGEGAPEEIEWLRNNLPLKSSYILWKLGRTKEALSNLKLDYERVSNANNISLIKQYLNSIAYYEFELYDPKNLDTKILNSYISQFEAYKLDSVKHAEPECVDTYAWLCFLVGDYTKAINAIRGVEEAICYPDGPDTTYLEHKSKIYPIVNSDAKIIHFHVSEIKRKVRAMKS